MDDRRNLRAADADRQATVDRLRGALDEGRLKMEEYLERMEQAYQAVTYGELAELCRDLPEAAVQPRQPAAGAPAPAAAARPPGPAPKAAAAPAGFFARQPAPLKVLWTIWLIAVSVNLVVWVLVSATTAHFIYPWPLWVAGPYGAVLLAISAAVSAGRRGHGPAGPALPPGRGG